MTPALRLRFLGAMELHWDDQPLPKPATRKAQSLLAYLVTYRGRPQPRDHLANLFWGERPEHKARRSLTTALWHIRRCFPDEIIQADVPTVRFESSADSWCDVTEFEALVTREDVTSLQSAVDLYRSEFLAGFYDDWVISERSRLENLFHEALTRLMVELEAQAEYEAALAAALRLLDGDPLREDAHRLVMRAYCHLGHRNQALEQYQRCEEMLRQELDVTPTSETAALHQAIREGRFPVGPAPQAVAISAPTKTPTGRNPLDVVTPGPLVGREPELTFLHQLWQERSGLVLVGGEAGVGKTRLVQEFADQVRRQGARVLWGRCYEFERLLPYQPFAEVLRALTPADLANAPAEAVVEVSRLVPELRSRRPGLAAPAEFTTGRTRLLIFDGLTRLLAGLARSDPLLLVVEDLHWATESTLQLLHYLTRHLRDDPALLVGTFRTELTRPGHPLLDLQRQLEREGLAQSLDLARLSPAAVAELVLAMAGAGAAAESLAARLYQETEGNPFFLMETVNALFAADMLRLEAGAWQGDWVGLGAIETSASSVEPFPLPASVRAAIEGRVRHLDEETQALLHLAAVAGREFDFDLLHAVWDRGEEATLEALDDLLRHRLIDEGAGPLGRDYAFTHHKVQEVVYAGLPRRRRQHLHARVGSVMEEVYATELEGLAGELAFHFLQGRQLDRSLTEKAITYLLLAADQARVQQAHQEAIDYYQRALVLLKERPDAERERTGRTLIKLGLAYQDALDFERAREAREEGLALLQAGESRT